MVKPVLLTVDDDAEVLRAVERDLRREYGNRFRVLRANSGESALETLRQLKLRNDPVALLLVDQRMPRMSGVEFIERANTIYPEAKRALLTAYPKLPPDSQHDALLTLSSRPSFAKELLLPLGRGDVARSALPASALRRLRELIDDESV